MENYNKIEMIVDMKSIALVVGSTRPGRVSRYLTEGIREILTETSSLGYDIVDLAEVPLPFLDEPVRPALHQYEREHTIAWSERVRGFDGFLFITPQYNWGYPAVLKNALDYLYDEWHGKPASVVSYGARGGGKAAAQLLEVLHGLRMNVLPTHAEIVITEDATEPSGSFANIAAILDPVRATLLTMDSEFTAATGSAKRQ